MSVGFTSAPGSTSSSLVERVQARDPQAWRRFVHLYSPLVYYWCRRAGLQPGDAADILQNVFQSVVTGIDRFRHDRPDDTLRGWLWTIARNRLRDHFRSQRERPDLLAEANWQDVPDPLGDALASDDPPPEQLHPLLARALDLVRAEFEERTWQAFWQSVVEGQAAAEVATALGLSVNSVYKAKSRILARLREELGDVPP